MGAKQNRLLLFDIDCTLLNTGGAGMNAFHGAIEDLYSDNLIGGNSLSLDMAGSTDSGLVIEIFKSLGIEDSVKETSDSSPETNHNITEIKAGNWKDEIPLLHKYEVIFWAGDFNYRINTTRENAVDKIMLHYVTNNNYTKDVYLPHIIMPLNYFWDSKYLHELPHYSLN